MSIEKRLILSITDDNLPGVRKVLQRIKNPGRLQWKKGSHPLQTAIDCASQHDYQLKILKELLKAGINVDSADTDGFTALHFAAKNVNLAVLTILMEKKPLLNAKTKFAGNTPLHYAAMGRVKESLAFIKVLLDFGADPNLKNKGGKTPLELAKTKNVGLSFTRYEAFKTEVISSSELPIERQVHLAVILNHLPTVLSLLPKLPNRNRTQWSRFACPLHIAAQAGDEVMIFALLNAGFDINSVDDEKWTVLHYATLDGHASMVGKLLKMKADPNAQTQDGSTASHFAGFYQHQKVSDRLSKHNSDMDLANNEGDTVNDLISYKEKDKVTKLEKQLTEAAEANDLDTVNRLLPEIKWRSRPQWTDDNRCPLHTAVIKGHVDVVRALLDGGFNIDSELYNLTPFHKACFEHCTLPVLKLLLERGVSLQFRIVTPELPDFTPLHAWAKKDDPEAVKLLLQYGANPTEKDFDGLTPFDVAKKCKKFENARLLKTDDLAEDIDKNLTNEPCPEYETSKSRSWVEVKESELCKAIRRKDLKAVKKLATSYPSRKRFIWDEFERPLHLASEMGELNILKALQAADFDIHSLAGDDMTVLHYAAKEDRVGVIRYLLSEGVDLEAKDSFMGQTALQWAMCNEKTAATQALLDAKAKINVPSYFHGTAREMAQKDGRKEILDMFEKHEEMLKSQDDYFDEVKYKEAVEYLDFDQVERILHNCPDPGRSQWDVSPGPLHFAVMEGEENLVQILLGIGVDVNAKDATDNTALYVACVQGSTRMVKLLLDAGADIKIKCKDGRNAHPGETALDVAAESGYKDIVDMMLNHHKEKRTRPSEPRYKEIVGNLLRQHQDDSSHVISPLNSGGTGQLALAASSDDGKTHILFRLKDSGRNGDASAAGTFHVAAQHGHLETTRLFIDSGVDVNCVVDGKTALMHAAANGYVPIVHLLLNRGAKSNVQDPDGWTALHEAAKANKPMVLKALLSGGADKKIRNYDGKTPYDLYKKVPKCKDEILKLLDTREDAETDDPFMYDVLKALTQAASQNDFQTVKLLLPKVRNIGRREWSSAEIAPLQEAAAKGNVKIVRFLLDKGFAVDSTLPNRTTPLHTACMLGHVEIAEFLLSRGAEIDKPGTNGWSALHIAITSRNNAVAKLLTDNGANCNVRDNNGSSPLHLAVSLSLVPTVVTLLLAGADFLVRRNDGTSVLDLVKQVGHPEVYTIFSKKFELIEKGGPLTEKSDLSCLLTHHPPQLTYTQSDIDNETALHNASLANDIRAVRRLLPKIKNPGRRNWPGHCYPLHIAALNGHERITRLLLDAGFDVDSEYPVSNTVLLFAAQGNDGPTLRLILAKKPRLNAQNSDIGVTGLHTAAQFDKPLAAKLLLEAGADPNISDYYDETPLDTAEDNDHKETARVIREFGGKHESELNTEVEKQLHTAVQDKDIPSVKRLLTQIENPGRAKWDTTVHPFHSAVSSGQRDVVDLLLDAGFNVDSTTPNGMTALHYAVKNGRAGVTQTLVERGAELDAQEGYDRNTALHAAWESKDLESVDVLLGAGAKTNIKNRKGQTFMEVSGGLTSKAVEKKKKETKPVAIPEKEITPAEDPPEEKEDPLVLLMCLICGNFPRSSVFACDKGHMTCEACDTKARQLKKTYRCTVCQQNYLSKPPAQSSALEWMAEKGKMNDAEKRTLKFLLRTKSQI